MVKRLITPQANLAKIRFLVLLCTSIESLTPQTYVAEYITAAADDVVQMRNRRNDDEKIRHVLG